MGTPARVRELKIRQNCSVAVMGMGCQQGLCLLEFIAIGDSLLEQKLKFETLLCRRT